MPGFRSCRRRLTFLLAALAAVLLCSIAPAAASAAKTTPGDNGDVKIHAVGTSFLDHRNQPHVCQFDLDAFNFDTVQLVSWTISQQPPTGRATAASGTLTLTNGMGHTAVMSLPAGHYKLTWTFTGEHGRAKFKVFWSDCAAIASPPPGTIVVSGGGTTIGTVNSAGQIVAPNGKVVGLSLAETGSSVAPWLASGAGLLLAGGLLVRRTRGRRGH